MPEVDLDKIELLRLGTFLYPSWFGTVRHVSVTRPVYVCMAYGVWRMAYVYSSSYVALSTFSCSVRMSWTLPETRGALAAATDALYCSIGRLELK